MPELMGGGQKGQQLTGEEEKKKKEKSHWVELHQQGAADEAKFKS